MFNEWRVIVHNNKEKLAKSVAARLRENMQQEAQPIWCLASGSTPMASYQKFTAAVREHKLNAEHLTIFALDEWMGLGNHETMTCHHFINEMLIQPLNISSDRYFHFDTNGDEETEIQKMKKALENSPQFDLCVLGLGLNGHIGFNEPALCLPPSIHGCNLSEISLTHKMINDIIQKPSQGLTIGIKEILTSKTILLLITGEAKIGITQQLFASLLDTKLPASFLKLHNNVEIHIDYTIGKNLHT